MIFFRYLKKIWRSTLLYGYFFHFFIVYMLFFKIFKLSNDDDVHTLWECFLSLDTFMSMLNLYFLTRFLETHNKSITEMNATNFSQVKNIYCSFTTVETYN